MSLKVSSSETGRASLELVGQTRKKFSPNLFFWRPERSAIFSHTMGRNDAEERTLEKSCLDRLDLSGAPDSFRQLDRGQKVAWAGPEERLIDRSRERPLSQGKINAPSASLSAAQEPGEPLRQGTTNGEREGAPRLKTRTQGDQR